MPFYATADDHGRKLDRPVVTPSHTSTRSPAGPTLFEVKKGIGHSPTTPGPLGSHLSGCQVLRIFVR